MPLRSSLKEVMSRRSLSFSGRRRTKLGVSSDSRPHRASRTQRLNSTLFILYTIHYTLYRNPHYGFGAIECQDTDGHLSEALIFHVFNLSQVLAEKADKAAGKASELAGAASKEAQEAKGLIEGSVRACQDAVTEANRAADKADRAKKEAEAATAGVESMNGRVTQLEKDSARLVGEAAAVDALRAAVAALDLGAHKDNKTELEEMGRRIAGAEKVLEEGVSDLETEIRRLESMVGGKTQVEALRNELTREIERLHGMVTADKGLSMVEPLKRDIEANKRRISQAETHINSMSLDQLRPEDIMNKVNKKLEHKADIDYVDEANDISASREARELNSLKRKFNDLLNFLSTIPGIGGQQPTELKPRGTKHQALACISCDRGGSPPRDDPRGTDGHIYQGEMTTGPQGQFPARMNASIKERPQSAPGKRGTPRKLPPTSETAPLNTTTAQRGAPQGPHSRVSTVHIAGPLKEGIAPNSRQRPVSAGPRREVKTSVVTPKFS